MNHVRNNFRWYVLVVLLLSTIFIWYAVIREDRQGILTVAFLDIGQGDAIYIEAPNGNQMLVDGGPPKTVLRALSRMMPFYDRSIDMLLVTNPDKDHMGGFIDILKNFRVGAVVEPGTVSPTETYKLLEETIADKKVKKLIGRRGMKIDLGGGALLSIIFPDRDASKMKTNDGSIVGRLSYGGSSVMLTGDAPQNVERYLTSLDGKTLKSDVLKVGHHGSRTSSSPEFVGFVSPEYAVISDGEGNSYGHPHKETLDTLNKFGVKIFRTDKIGTVVMTSDGESFRVPQ